MPSNCLKASVMYISHSQNLIHHHGFGLGLDEGEPEWAWRHVTRPQSGTVQLSSSNWQRCTTRETPASKGLHDQQRKPKPYPAIKQQFKLSAGKPSQHLTIDIRNPLEFNSTVDTLQRSFFCAHANEWIIMQEVFPETWCVSVMYSAIY